jgi:hypothetical protein
MKKSLKKMVLSGALALTMAMTLGIGLRSEAGVLVLYGASGLGGTPELGLAVLVLAIMVGGDLIAGRDTGSKGWILPVPASDLETGVAKIFPEIRTNDVVNLSDLLRTSGRAIPLANGLTELCIDRARVFEVMSESGYSAGTLNRLGAAMECNSK